MDIIDENGYLTNEFKVKINRSPNISPNDKSYLLMQKYCIDVNFNNPFKIDRIHKKLKKIKLP